MESIQWNSSFNSSFHVNPSSTPFNFPRTLVKTSSFNELGNSSLDSVLAPKLDAAMFSGLSSAVLAAAAAGSFVPSSTISPFFHSIQMPALSRSISSEYTATPAVASVEASELESPDSDSRSLCLSPDEQETQEADREQNAREMAELDLHPAVSSPRSEADSDEWSVPATNNETDSANHSHTRTQTPTIPIIKNSSLMDITAATHHAGSAVKAEEFSDSENNDDQEESDNDNDNEPDLGNSENQREHEDDNDHDDELAEVEEDDAEAEAEVELESDIEEEVLARPARSSRRCKASKQKSKINSSRQVASKQGRRGSSARKAPISSAARLASQKKYDEKRRGIYRRLYTDLKDAIRAAQEVEGVKRDALEEQRLAELKRGKKKKKKKQKEIEDLSTRELLMLATNTIQLLQNHKNQLDQEWSQVKSQTAKEENEEENVKPERADRKRKRGGVKNERQMKINNKSQTMGADSIKSESDCSPPKRSRTDSSTTSTSSSSSSSSNVVNALLAALNNSQSGHQVALPLPINPSTMSWSNTPIKPEFVSPSNSSSSSSTSSSSPLLLLGANSASSSAPVVTVIDEAKRRAIFLFLFLRLRSLVLSSPPLLSVLQTSNSNSGQLWKATLMSLLNCEWTEESVRVVPQEKLFVKMSQMIWALQCMQQDIEVITAGQKNPQMKEHWANVATVKRELESYAGNNVTNDS